LRIVVPVTTAQPTTVAGVIARLEAIQAASPRSDGVACFARLYSEVTKGVNAELARSSFADPAFLERLDIVFANLFFDAVESLDRSPASTPSAWAPLFAARSRSGIAPLQFALAGMNAHINRDLPVALVVTCEERGIELRAGSPQHSDFRRVNDLLALVEERVSASYMTGVLAFVNRVLHRHNRLDDVIAMWNVRRARDAAWVNGEVLWALRRDASLRAEFVATLDRTTGFAGRGLLVPTETGLRGLGRLFGR
jgi:hypothetical protein